MAIDPNLVTTIRTGELPTSSFSLTDKIAHEVGTDLKQSTIEQLIAFIAPLISAIQFQVITLHVNALYIANNFDGTGLGINLMTGYAIVNGNNGTINKDGRVGIAYGTITNVIGQVGGEKEVSLNANQNGAHTHVLQGSVNTSGGSGAFVVNNVAHTGGDVTTGVSGLGTPHNNMQPYLVELQVMKL